VELVPELCGWLNSQCAEQLFFGMRKNNSLLTHLSDAKHLASQQHQHNSRTIEYMKTRLGMGVDIVLNSNGQTVLGMYSTLILKS